MGGNKLAGKYKMLSIIGASICLVLLICCPLLANIQDKKYAFGIFGSVWYFDCKKDFYKLLEPLNLIKMKDYYEYWTKTKILQKKFNKWLEKWLLRQDTHKQHIDCHIAISYLCGKVSYQIFYNSRLLMPVIHCKCSTIFDHAKAHDKWTEIE
jgi:hypothetical protein